MEELLQTGNAFKSTLYMSISSTSGRTFPVCGRGSKPPPVIFYRYPEVFADDDGSGRERVFQFPSLPIALPGIIEYRIPVEDNPSFFSHLDWMLTPSYCNPFFPRILRGISETNEIWRNYPSKSALEIMWVPQIARGKADGSGRTGGG